MKPINLPMLVVFSLLLVAFFYIYSMEYQVVIKKQRETADRFFCVFSFVETSVKREEDVPVTCTTVVSANPRHTQQSSSNVSLDAGVDRFSGFHPPSLSKIAFQQLRIVNSSLLLVFEWLLSFI